MKANRRVTARWLAAGLIAAAAGSALGADAWPTKPVRLIVPFAPGGATDIFARALAQRLQASLGQNVIIDNRGGAGGMLGASIGAKAEPDGYSLLFTSDSPITIGVHLTKNVPYDPLKDFTPIGKVVTIVNCLVVHPKIQVKSVQDLIALAKTRKPPLTFSSSGAGAFGHLTGELFKASTGVELTHVPYKGGGPAMAALAGGETDLSFATSASAAPHIKSGRLILLAVPNTKRAKLLPDVPTIAESGVKGVAVDNWQGVVAPARVPAPIAEKLIREVTATVKSREFDDIAASQGGEADPLPGREFGKFIAADSARWKSLIERNHIRAD